jgi:hypothetical protein
MQHQTQEKLRRKNAAFQQQIAELQTDNQGFSNRLASVGDANKLSEKQFNELLKLRGEVGVLRKQTSDLSQDNEMLKRRLAVVSRMETNQVPTPQLHIKARFIAIPKDGFSTQIGGINGATGILGYQNFTNLFAILKRRAGVEVLAEPEATTTSGRQVQMRATQVETVITNFALVESNGASAVVPQSCQVETGPIIDVTPQILSDGRTITLPIDASVTDFLGYGQPTNNPVPNYTTDGEEVDVPQVLPQFRVQQASAKVNMWDDQTLVLKLPDKQVPSHASLQSSNDPKVQEPLRNTLVFVTVTMIDAAGNKEYKLNESDSVPAQPDSSTN